MSQNNNGKPGAPDTDILSAIRRIVDEEQTGAAAATAPKAAAPRSALVLTPTMRVNALDDDLDDLPPLRLTERVDAVGEAEASQARSLRSAFGRDQLAKEALEPLRLQPAARVDEAPQGEIVPAPTPEAAPAPTALPMSMSGFAGQSVDPAPQPEAPVAKSVPEPEALVAMPAPEAAVPAQQPAAPETGIAGMDRAALEALITEKLRQDLSGELGARISSNIRTLVQREVATAVAAELAKRQP
jgi:hypothetical protein